MTLSRGKRLFSGGQSPAKWEILFEYVHFRVLHPAKQRKSAHVLREIPVDFSSRGSIRSDETTDGSSAMGNDVCLDRVVTLRGEIRDQRSKIRDQRSVDESPSAVAEWKTAAIVKDIELISDLSLTLTSTGCWGGGSFSSSTS